MYNNVFLFSVIFVCIVISMQYLKVRKLLHMSILHRHTEICQTTAHAMDTHQETLEKIIILYVAHLNLDLEIR